LSDPSETASGYESEAGSTTFEEAKAGPEQPPTGQPKRIWARGVTPRRTAWTAAALLTAVLAALLLYLFWLLLPNSSASVDTVARSGLQAQFVIAGPGRGTKPLFNQPMGAAWGPNGRIYVADTGNNRIAVFDKRGRFLFEFGSFGIAKPLPGAKASWKPGSLNYPTAVAVDQSSGDVYVADFYNNTIEVFNRSGRYLRRFPDPNKVVGKGGSGIDGKGIAVTDVAVADGRVYATDAFQILVFDTSGRLLQQFGKPGGGDGDLDRPNGVAVAGHGSIVVSDSNHSRLIRFDKDGHAVQTVGKQVREVSQPTTNPFILPRGLSVLDDGSVIVADPLGMQLVRVGRDGKVIVKYGERGLEPAQLNFANDVDSLGPLLVIADRGNDRVQVVKIVRR
jgi:sugar lactone lactonase YvrE